MFYILSKTLDIFLMPLVWVLLLLLASLVPRLLKHRKKFVLAAIALLYLGSNQFLVNELWLWWERPPKQLSELPFSPQQPARYAVVLTGVINVKKSPAERTFTAQGADRFIAAQQLYAQGLVEKIIITGSYATSTGKSYSEPQLIANLLLNMGVPESDIILEEAARNTRENALEVQKLLQAAGNESEPFILITSAFHMRRAEGCFNKLNLNFTTYPVDYYTHDRELNPAVLLVPSAQHFFYFSKLVREVFGMVVYKVLGYV
jgi:uncharacterized SAM-binding protein YcdF (DUF218 family)